MNKLTRRLILLAAVTVTALLAVGATAASAHRGPGRGEGHGYGRVSTGALVTEAAKQLGVTRAKLKDAIVDAAIARIDEAVQDEDVEADEADELKEDARDNLRFAYSISRTRAVASNLGITVAKLNTEFRDARRALILARINDEVEEGDLEEDEAAELKEELADAELPGYKAAGFRGFGFGRGHGGFGK